VYQGKPDILPAGVFKPIGRAVEPARAAPGVHSIIVYSHTMQGLHLTADLYRCRCDATWLTDAQRLSDWCLQAAEAVGLQPVNQLFQAFPGAEGGAGGVNAAVLLAESHVCLHTWPEQKAVTLDVYVCNLGGDHSAKARGLMHALVNRFQPEWTEQRSLDRGDGE
jgi:S-adenosylmethionine decarboxylase